MSVHLIPSTKSIIYILYGGDNKEDILLSQIKFDIENVR